MGRRRKSALSSLLNYKSAWSKSKSRQRSHHYPVHRKSPILKVISKEDAKRRRQTPKQKFPSLFSLFGLSKKKK